MSGILKGKSLGARSSYHWRSFGVLLSDHSSRYLLRHGSISKAIVSLKKFIMSIAVANSSLAICGLSTLSGGILQLLQSFELILHFCFVCSSCQNSTFCFRSIKISCKYYAGIPVLGSALSQPSGPGASNWPFLDKTVASPGCISTWKGSNGMRSPSILI